MTQANPSTRTVRVSLTSLPIEIIAETLLYTCSPPTVLAVSRTCSFLYRSLAQNPDASFIWRRVRKTCEPIPLPDPGDGWKKSEADYAAFVFGGGVCEVCQNHTRAMYVSFAARIRLCGSWHCRRNYLDKFLVNVTSELRGEDLWVPPLESTRCFYPARLGALIWPRGEILLRRRDWVEFQRQLQVYKDAEQAEAERKRVVAPSLVGEEVEQTKRILERRRAAIQKLPQIMEVSIRLICWKWKYDEHYKRIKKENDTWTKDLADDQGWDLGNLVASQIYGSLQRRKTLLLEHIKFQDVVPMRPAIESELLVLQARHKRQKAEATHREKLTEVKKIYGRMRSGTLGIADAGAASPRDPWVLPPLSVFCALPSVRALKGSPDPDALWPGNTSVPSDIDSSLAISLITTDVHNWLVPVQKHLMTLLGYPNGWQSASTRTVPPLRRVTARFFCQRCGEGKVGKGYRRERCLDYRGVCSHVCMTASGKSDREEAPEERQTQADIGDGDGQDKGKGVGKKKGGGGTLDWKVDVFEKDEKAISIIKTILNLTGLSEESPAVTTAMKALGGTIRCMTCKGWIVMDFESAIGHAHRHESMQIELLSMFSPRSAGFLNKDASAPTGNGSTCQTIPSGRLAFERGNVELLLGLTFHGRNLCKKVNYGCKHCFVDGHDTAVMEKDQGKRRRVMNFNALRSHVKAKHGVQEICDEDFFCYDEIQKQGEQ